MADVKKKYFCFFRIVFGGALPYFLRNFIWIGKHCYLGNGKIKNFVFFWGKICLFTAFNDASFSSVLVLLSLWLLVLFDFGGGNDELSILLNFKNGVKHRIGGDATDKCRDEL